MKKKYFFRFSIIMLILLAISACGKPTIGMNELSLKQLENKLDNHESFLLLTFAANRIDVKKTKLIEAFDGSFKRGELTGFYINLDGESKKTIEKLSQKYTHPSVHGEWEPLEDGLVLVFKEGVTDFKVSSIDQNLIDDQLEKNKPFEVDDFHDDNNELFEYIKFYNIDVH